MDDWVIGDQGSNHPINPSPCNVRKEVAGRQTGGLAKLHAAVVAQTNESLAVAEGVVRVEGVFVHRKRVPGRPGEAFAGVGATGRARLIVEITW